MQFNTTISHLSVDIPNGLYLEVFLPQVHQFLIACMRATFFDHPFDVIITYRLQHFLLRTSLHRPLAPPF